MTELEIEMYEHLEEIRKLFPLGNSGIYDGFSIPIIWFRLDKLDKLKGLWLHTFDYQRDNGLRNKIIGYEMYIFPKSNPPSPNKE